MIEAVAVSRDVEGTYKKEGLRCAFGWYDDEDLAHPCDKPAPYIWGGQDRMYVMSLCKQHLEEQYSNRRRI